MNKCVLCSTTVIRLDGSPTDSRNYNMTNQMCKWCIKDTLDISQVRCVDCNHKLTSFQVNRECSPPKITFPRFCKYCEIIVSNRLTCDIQRRNNMKRKRQEEHIIEEKDKEIKRLRQEAEEKTRKLNELEEIARNIIMPLSETPLPRPTLPTVIPEMTHTTQGSSFTPLDQQKSAIAISNSTQFNYDTQPHWRALRDSYNTRNGK